MERLRRGPYLVLLVCAAAACSLGFAAPAMADFTVNNLSDTDDADQGGTFDGVCDTVAGGAQTCTLRAAVEEANANANSDTITFSITGTHSIFNVLQLDTPVTILGNGSGTSGTVLDGNDSGRLMFITGTASAVTLQDIRLQNGHVFNPGGGNGGAAIANQSPSLSLNNATVTSNDVSGTGAGQGGGILGTDSADSLEVENSTISDNTISSTTINDGGGIHWAGALTITDSTVSGNQITAGTGTGGGGVATSATGSVAVTRSTFSGNAIVSGSFGAGGGALAAGAALTATNSTFSGNSAGNITSGEGGGIIASGTNSIIGSTFAGNTAMILGADIEVTSGTTTVKNTIFGSSSACAPSGGTIASATPGNNIDVGTTCGFGTANGNRQNTDPLLGALALNAPGTTMTRALLSGSPAIDTATADCGGLTTDQRGVSRPQFAGGSCDVGAFELEKSAPPPPPAPPSAGPTPTTPQPAKKKCKKHKQRAAAAKKCKKRK